MNAQAKTIEAEFKQLLEAQAQFKQLREDRELAYARVTDVVHHGAISRFILRGRVGPKPVGSSMPDYMLEHHDFGLHEPKEFKPTPRQIDCAYMLDTWMSDYRDKARPINGIEDWKWEILRLRGTQVIFSGGKGGWRLIKRWFDAQPNGKSFSHERLKQIHKELVDIAFDKAIARGYVSA